MITDYKSYLSKLDTLLRDTNSNSTVTTVGTRVEPKISQFEENSNTKQPISKSAIDIGILCALPDPEHTMLAKAFPELKRLNAPLGEGAFSYHSGAVKTRSGKNLSIVSAHQNEMGMVAASYHMADMISRFQCRYYFMTGICAGVGGPVRIGDLLIPSMLFDYGSGKITESKFSPDYRPVQISGSLHSSILQTFVARKETPFLERHGFFDGYSNGARPGSVGFNIFVNPLASGAGVVSSSKIIDEIKENQRKLTGIDMEAYGFGKTISVLQPNAKFAVFKCVSDLADRAKSDEYQEYCSFLSAKYLRIFLEQTEIFVD